MTDHPLIDEALRRYVETVTPERPIAESVLRGELNAALIELQPMTPAQRLEYVNALHFQQTQQGHGGLATADEHAAMKDSRLIIRTAMMTLDVAEWTT